MNSNDNLKKAGIVNTILILLDVGLGMAAVCMCPGTFGKLELMIDIIALVFGFVYAIRGYIKDGLQAIATTFAKQNIALG